MQLFAHGFNKAGFAYRGDHQNSNTFAAAALRAGELPTATGVAHDPAGPPGELLEFFAPGLNEPLRAPIGPHSSYEPAQSPALRELQRYNGFAALHGPASTSVRAVPPAAVLEPGMTAKRAVPVLARFIGDSLITPAQAASRLLPGPTGPNAAIDESTFGDRSNYAQGAPSTDTYPRLRRISSAIPGLTTPNPGQPAPPPAPVLNPAQLAPASRPAGDSKQMRILARRIVGQPQASISNTSTPAAPLAPSDDCRFLGRPIRQAGCSGGHRSPRSDAARGAAAR